MNGIKHLSDNSPDGQTRNQESIRTAASSSPYPFNHSIPTTNTHRHLPRTWACNYIFHFPTAAKQLRRWQFARLINQNSQEPLDCQAQQPPPPHTHLPHPQKQSLLAQAGHHWHIRSQTVQDTDCGHINCSSPPPGPLLPNHMTEVHHLSPNALRWGWEAEWR